MNWPQLKAETWRPDLLTAQESNEVEGEAKNSLKDMYRESSTYDHNGARNHGRKSWRL